MSIVKEIDSPYTIATLTQPIDRTNGRILAARVYSLHGSRKRKRSEVAVSADGEGIQIYNVQTPRVVASYAVPPQAIFTSPPCCAYRKSSRSRPARRYTYASVVQKDGGRPCPQVIGFDEELEAKALGRINKLAYDLPEGRSEIAAIESVPLAGDEESRNYAHNVLVIYKNGHIDCLTADLKEVRWSHKLRDVVPGMTNKTAENSKVEYTCIINSSTACHGLLRDREDILATLGGGVGSDSDRLSASSILCYITGPNRTKDLDKYPISLHLVTLPANLVDNITSSRSQPRHLVSWSLAGAPVRSSSQGTSYSLQAEAGSLSYLSVDGVVTYDLRGTVPKQSSCLAHPEVSFRSFLSLQHSLSLVCSESFCGLFDIEHKSLQAFIRFSEANLTNGESKKRQRGISAPGVANVKFLGYFANLDLAVGLTDTELVGFSLNSILPSNKSKSQKSSLLVNSIGKGINPKATHFTRTTVSDSLATTAGPIAISTSGEVPKHLQDTIQRLDKLADQDKVYEFEYLFAEAAGMQRDTSQYDTRQAHKNQNGVVTNGTNAMDIDETSADERPIPAWIFDRSFDAQSHFEHRPLALYALSKIFSWVPLSNGQAQPHDRATSIAIHFYTPNLFQYLLKLGYLSRDVIQRALRSTNELPGEGRTIAEGDLVTAVVNSDPGLGRLRDMLNAGAYLEIGEITQIVKILIQNLDTKSLPQLTSQSLPNGKSGDSEELDVDIENAIDSMSALIDHAQSSLEDGADELSHCLQPALIALHSFPKARVISYLRLNLTAHELYFLMNMLRIQLQGGGWVHRYFVESAESDLADSEGPSDAAILIIADLLSHVLDAIGTGGWLLAAQQTPESSEDAPDDLIHDLRADVSAAVEGIYEATFMKGLLTEFLRYGSRIKSANKIPDAGRLQTQRKPFPIGTHGAPHGESGTALPLGLRVKGKVAMKKNERGGGEASKSQREIGMEISKTVPKYSIERIDI